MHPRHVALVLVVLSAGGCYRSFELGDSASTHDVATSADGASGSATAVVQLASGALFTCALLASGHVWCWGGVDLGDGAGSVHTVPAEVPALSDVASLVPAAEGTYAVHASGAVTCIGLCRPGAVTTGAELPELEGAVEIAAGGTGVCVLRASGVVECLGSASPGAFGPTGVREHLAPVLGVSAVDVVVGGLHTCALLTSGPVVCWGADAGGALGTGPGVRRPCTTSPGIETRCADSPILIPGIDDAIALTTGEMDRTCALRASGGVTCWGPGPLGDGTREASPLPVAPTGVDDVVQLASGTLGTCARRSSGTVACWGMGTPLDGTTPVDVPGLDDAVDVAPGLAHVCALRASGDVVCWGSDTEGTLGDHGRALPASATPVVVVIP